MDDAKPGRLLDVLVPEHALSFTRRLPGEILQAMPDRLGMIQGATDAILLAWSHENSGLAHPPLASRDAGDGREGEMKWYQSPLATPMVD